MSEWMGWMKWMNEFNSWSRLSPISWSVELNCSKIHTSWPPRWQCTVRVWLQHSIKVSGFYRRWVRNLNCGKIYIIKPAKRLLNVYSQKTMLLEEHPLRQMKQNVRLLMSHRISLDTENDTNNCTAPWRRKKTKQTKKRYSCVAEQVFCFMSCLLPVQDTVIAENYQFILKRWVVSQLEDMVYEQDYEVPLKAERAGIWKIQKEAEVELLLNEIIIHVDRWMISVA